MNKSQKEWCKKYERETGFEPLMEDFNAGDETFEQAAKRNIEWFEDWSNDAYRSISNIPDDEPPVDGGE